MKEAPIERECRKIAEDHGFWLLKILPLNFVGFPDRTLLGPGPTIMFFEFKRPKGGVRSKAQERRVKTLKNWGFTAEFITSVEQFKEIVGWD